MNFIFGAFFIGWFFWSLLRFLLNKHLEADRLEQFEKRKMVAEQTKRTTNNE